MQLANFVILSFAFCRGAATADEVPPKPILSGKPLEAALAQRRSISYDNGALRLALRDLQDSTGICIILDRRIDPSSSVTLATPYSSNAEVISAVAQHVGAAASFGEHFVMVGPKVSVAKLQTLTELNKKTILGLRRRLGSSVYRKLVEAQNYAWPQLAQPRRILLGAANNIGLQVNNPELIPHDLLAEASLPATTFCDVATAILLQYDLTFEVSEEGLLTFVTVPDSVAVEKKYRVSANDKIRVLERWSKRFPRLEISWRGNFATLATTVENHSILQQLLTGEQPDSVAAASLKTRTFTFKVPPGTKLGQVVAFFKERAIPIRFQGASPEEVEAVLQQVVQFDMSEKLGAEFFAEVFKDTGAKVVVSDTEVVLNF